MPSQDFEIVDKRFGRVVNRSAKVEKRWGDGIYTEGPAYFPASRSLIWSDIPNDRLMRWDELTGVTGVFREEQGRYTNGNTVDRQGRFISCEQGTRQVTRTEHDGTITILAQTFEGKRFNSPNDVVVKSDGSIWFTDPSYGITSSFEGFQGESEICQDNVYCIDPTTGECKLVADDFYRPNGLAFSLDEKKLYIVDSGGTSFPDGPRHIREFNVSEDNSLSGGAVFATCTSGVFDGFRFDEKGRIWTSAGDGVHCLDTDGTLLGKILIPEAVSNLCFGGLKRNRLFITAESGIYTILLPMLGAKTF